MTDVVIVGYKDTKEVLSLVFALMKAYDLSKQDDGKIDFKDVTNFLPIVFLVGPAFSDIKNVSLELRTETPEQTEELKQWITTQIELTDEELEKFLEDAFALVIGLYRVLTNYVFKPEVAFQKTEGSTLSEGIPS